MPEKPPQREAGKKMLTRFMSASQAAGIDVLGRRELYDKYAGAADKDIVIESETLGDIDKATVESILKVLFKTYRGQTTIRSSDQRRVFELGKRFYDFGDTQFQPDKEILDETELRYVTLLTKYLEGFFYDGEFIEIAQQDRDATIAITFLINRMAKIYTNEHYKDKLQEFDSKELGDLIKRVNRFAENAHIFGTDQELRKVFDKSKAQMVQRVEQADAGKRKTVGLYLLKDSIVAAAALRSGHGLKSLIVPATFNHGKAGFDFQSGQFGQDVAFFRSGGSRTKVHYDPRDIIFAGVAVEYFKSQK